MKRSKIANGGRVEEKLGLREVPQPPDLTPPGAPVAPIPPAKKC